MKSLKKLLFSGLILVVLLVSFSVTSADVPGPGWWTTEQIQATTAGDTTTGKTSLNLTAYDRTSTATYSCGDKLLSQGEAFVFVPTAAWGVTPNCGGLPAGFQGSAVVEANYDVVAMVEVTNQFAAPLGASGGTAAASYRGTSDADTDTTLRFPLYKSNHYGETSTFYIQNAGGTATTVKATFQECAATTFGCAGSGRTFVKTYTTPIEPNRMMVIVPGDATGMPAGNGYFGSLTVESLNGQKLAGVVNEAATTASGAARFLKSTRAFTSKEYDTKLYAPVVKHTYPPNAGADTKWSALQIQNVGGVAGNFTIEYKIVYSFSDPARKGATFTDTTSCVNIPVGQTCFVLTAYPVAGSGTAQIRPGEYASAKVTGNVNMVAVVNEETMANYQPAADKQQSAYSAVADKVASKHASVPAYKEEWYGRYMGVTVQNVGDAPTTVTARIKNVGVVPPAVPPTAELVAQRTNLAPGAAVTFMLLTQNQSQLYEEVTIVSGSTTQFKNTNNSMDIQAGQKLAVIVTQDNSYLHPPAVKLDTAMYEGFPLP